MKRDGTIYRRLAVAVTGLVLLVSAAFAPAPEEAGTIVVDGRTFSANQNCKGDTWKYVADEHTLYLDGFEGMYIDLSTQEEAVIEVTGSNKVTSNLNCPAIMVTGNLQIRGEGTLDVEVTACHSAIYALGGDLLIDHCQLTVKGHGIAEEAAYLLMADDNLTMSGSRISVIDEIDGEGGVAGSLGGDILVGDGTTLMVFSRSKGLASLEGAVRFEGEDTSAEILATESAVYAKSEIAISGTKNVRAESSKPESTAVYCPEGNITISDTLVDICSEGAAMAGKKIEIIGGYIADPFDGEVKEISGMDTVILENTMVKEVHILTGAKPTPTPTPTPSPTPTPTPTPTPQPEVDEGFSVTPRMIVGGVLVIVALCAVAVIVVGKIRGRDE
ncbi:MAG: carbohydrate-binding domain-containing protein [Clostridiales bacterium]|nr:carbohydrate-binding domain-containing protein [Clostridiales bacterium]